VSVDLTEAGSLGVRRSHVEVVVRSKLAGRARPGLVPFCVVEQARERLGSRANQAELASGPFFPTTDKQVFHRTLETRYHR
jgi:hypothetical protein